MFSSTNNSQENILLPENIQPLNLPSDISNIELIQAEEKTEEMKEIIMEKQSLPEKTSNVVEKLLDRVWYNRAVSDEGDSPSETPMEKVTDDQSDKKIIAPDIDTSHSNNVENEIIEQEINLSIPSWIDDQVYGDKVSVRILCHVLIFSLGVQVILFSPTMYNVQQIDPDARWHQEPMVDVIFVSDFIGLEILLIRILGISFMV